MYVPLSLHGIDKTRTVYELNGVERSNVLGGKMADLQINRQV